MSTQEGERKRLGGQMRREMHGVLGEEGMRGERVGERERGRGRGRGIVTGKQIGRAHV